MKEKEILICDIETTSLKVGEAVIRVFGAYDPYENKFYIYKWNDYFLSKVMQLFATYKILVTFNGVKYDMPILERHGVPIKEYNHIDVMQIFKNKRKKMIRREGFTSYSMKNLIIALGLDADGSKEDMDYELFKKEHWTPQEQEIIISYLKQDLLSTWKLFNYVINRFRPMARFIAARDTELYKHITAPLPTYAYKAICFMSGISEYYDEAPKYKDNPLRIITNPRCEKSKKAVLMRFNHLYASIIMQFNLLSFNCKCCMTNEGRFHGGNFYNIKGYYCRRNPGVAEKFLKSLFRNNINDPEMKLVSNIIFDQIYDVISNPLYYSLYSPEVASDTIALAKQQLTILSRMFDEKGYKVLSIDIDNVFIEVDPDKKQSVEDLLIIKDEIITFLQSKMVFKSETFDLELVSKLQYLQFTRQNDNPENKFLIKGSYAYMTESGKIGYKGMTSEDARKMLQVIE